MSVITPVNGSSGGGDGGGGGGAVSFPPSEYRIFTYINQIVSFVSDGNSTFSLSSPANFLRYLVGVEFEADQKDALISIESFSAVDKNGLNHWSRGDYISVFKGVHGTYINLTNRFGSPLDCTGGLNNINMKNLSAVTVTNAKFIFHFMEIYNPS